jgi:hypothetical protein
LAWCSFILILIALIMLVILPVVLTLVDVGDVVEVEVEAHLAPLDDAYAKGASP